MINKKEWETRLRDILEPRGLYLVKRGEHCGSIPEPAYVICKSRKGILVDVSEELPGLDGVDHWITETAMAKAAAEGRKFALSEEMMFLGRPVSKVTADELRESIMLSARKAQRLGRHLAKLKAESAIEPYGGHGSAA